MNQVQYYLLDCLFSDDDDAHDDDGDGDDDGDDDGDGDNDNMLILWTYQVVLV